MQLCTGTVFYGGCPVYVSGTPIPGMKDEALWSRNLSACLGDYQLPMAFAIASAT